MERIFGREDAFAGAGGAWLVAYVDRQPVGCGGLRTLAPGIGEIKRRFVDAPARGAPDGGCCARPWRGARARAAADDAAARRGLRAVRRRGPRRVERVERGDGPVEIWLEKALS